MRRGRSRPRPQAQLLNQRASVRALGGRVGGDDYGCGYAVAGFHVQQADTLGDAAGFADCG